ncbi:MAG: hypothetical protein FRX49_13506 [Trebouxia sp. A1-2]|nr:MAG: hypothetical protein FRX49_13506 [Trebouxia sp. A1-2]
MQKVQHAALRKRPVDRGTGAASSSSSSELEATTPFLAVALAPVLAALPGFLANFAFAFGWLRSSKSPELQRKSIQHALSQAKAQSWLPRATCSAELFFLFQLQMRLIVHDLLKIVFH